MDSENVKPFVNFLGVTPRASGPNSYLGMDLPGCSEEGFGA